MNDSVPSVSKDSPLKALEREENYEESKVERRGKLVFVFGCVFAGLILISVWGLFAFWVKSFI